ncbi:MAG: DUF47 family protein [Sedimenticola sp.]
MDNQRSSFMSRVLERLVPKPPDFFALLGNQCGKVTETMRNLHNYMLTGDMKLSALLAQDEHEADKIKNQNLHELNKAFSTPIDRENIFRAIESMDWMVTHTKSTVNEMIDLRVSADDHMVAISAELLVGTEALQEGFIALSENPAKAERGADMARHAHRRIERFYRHALSDLFEGDDPVDMLRRREIYHHLMDGSRQLHRVANVLHDIMVQMV